ncbi:MAG: dynamin family protein [Muribaculaceae bacterium]|nr:dynamin family protein [Muribaculaceae bacterium]
MGRFKGKSSSEAKAKRDFVRINPYEIPEIALAVIANICSKNNMDDANPIIQEIKVELSKEGSDGLNFYEFVENNRKDLFDFDLVQKLRNELSEIVQELLAHENTNHTQVVVAGGFSAGKSSFLNALTGAGDLLPTGIDPCSMVQTYLYCSDKINETIVKAINLKNAVVRLDKDVLHSIQHESKSKVYLASVLDKLFVEIPSFQLDGFVFIDTPGYNNSDKKNDTNNRTDEATAMAAINKGNVLLWVIDAGAGTIPKNDRKIIDNYLSEGEDRKVAIIFNKADKKGEHEIRKIVEDTYLDLTGYGDAIIDVLGYSSQENRIYYSHKGFSITGLLQELKDSGNGNSGIERRIEAIESLFDDEIQFAELASEAQKKEKKDLFRDKDEAYKKSRSERDGTKEIMEYLNGIAINTYSEIFDAASGYSEVLLELLKHVADSVTNIHNDEVSKAMSHDSVVNGLQRLHNRLYSYGKKHDDITYNYYPEDTRNHLVEVISANLDRLDDLIEERYKELESREDDLTNEYNKFKDNADRMKKYRDTVVRTLKSKIKEFRNSAQVQDARLGFSQTTDIFTAIRSDSYSDFLNCFVKGVKLSETNSEGYTPMTYAVKMNRNDMVKFLSDNDASLDAQDGRGMNAFLTAVENANGPLIEYFIKSQPALVNSRSSKGESPQSIADKNSLGEWYKTKVR